ncbi:MAG: hypothetical protein JXB33_08080 [Clostridia bacterium]|nr:hypothetical protein [Clostridia bacterium]
MNARERLLNVLEGKKPDRIPVFTLIPFGIENGRFVPEQFHGYEDIDEWRKNDPLYCKLTDTMEKECDNIFLFKPACLDEQNIFINPRNVSIHSKTDDGNKVTMVYEAFGLQKTEVYQMGSGHKWITRHFCTGIDDALRLAEQEYTPLQYDMEPEGKINKLGERGISWCTIPSPVMSVCRLFNPQDFLLFSAIYRKEINRLMDIAFERTQSVLEKLLERTSSPVIRFGGAEHATPPMMSPYDFDRLVFEYDKPLMDLCHSMGKMTAVHCHGNIRHAVGRFVEMGVGQIDPVEALPWGDISLEEIRQITKDRITLTGNIQFSEISNESSEHIRERVRDIIRKAGPERLIISTTGTPPERIPQRQFDNYNAMIDETLKYRI